jgi:SSS family solute:Na+ symporter
VYTFLGGLTSAVYNEVLQFFLIVLGLSPLVIVALHDAGGWSSIQANLQPELTHAWKYMDKAENNPLGVNFMSLIFGLGFVMSFGYWCTDFLVVQRAMIAKNMSEAHSYHSCHSKNLHATDCGSSWNYCYCTDAACSSIKRICHPDG